MAGIRITPSAGIVPRSGPTTLRDNEAQIAVNTKLYNGELKAWSKPGSLPIKTFARPGAQSIFKIGDQWLSWSDDVDAVSGPIYALNEFPVYYTGNGSPKKTNVALANAGTGFLPRDYLEMGVPQPTNAPTVVASGGSGTPESRTYVFTFISMFGSIEEESAPSPASALVSALPGGSVTVGALPAAPAGKYNITKIRIYRSVTGSASTPYLKVADVNIGTTSYVDSVSAINLGNSLSSDEYLPPPSDMQGLVSMANGIMAGFRGNEVYFSEPFLPHAWPASYAMTVEYEIVGLAAFGESLLVATKGNPFVISGATPAAMTQSKLPLYEPCVSKRSIASDEGGALFASPNGIIKVSQGFAGNAIRNLFTRTEWQQYSPPSMLGEILDGRYYLFCDAPALQFVGALILDRNEEASPLTLTTLFTRAARAEPTTASLHIVDEQSSEIKQWESDQYAFLPYEWKSKLFVAPRPLNFAAAQIEADFGDVQISEAFKEQVIQLIAQNEQLFAANSNLRSTLAQNPTLADGLLGGSLLLPLPPSTFDGRYMTLTVFCQGKQVAVIPVSNSLPFRLPAGFKGDRWEFKFDGNIPIRFLKVAETGRGLSEL
jgi:hypothetical protein